MSQQRSAELRVLVRADAYWVLNLYRQAGEGSGAFVPSLRPAWRGVRGAAENPARSRAESARRAASNVRRYCAANGLDRFGTLTYRGMGQHDPVALRRDVAAFFRRLRKALGGRAFPYLWVAEWHKSGHGLHVHFAVGSYIDRAVIEAAWGHGFVHIKRIGDLPHGLGRWERSRVAARYLSKYVAKSFDGPRIAGLHRYEIAQGFLPAVVSFRASSRDELEEIACAHMGGAPDFRWSSDELEGWAAPPALWWSWR